MPVFLGLLAYYYNAVKAQLEDVQDRARIKAELKGQTTAFQRYITALTGFTTWADARFGPPWSWRCFNRVFEIAFVYPISLLFISWVFGMSGNIGSFILLPNIDFSQRLIFTMIILIILFAIYSYKIGNIIDYKSELVINIIKKSNIFIDKNLG